MTRKNEHEGWLRRSVHAVRGLFRRKRHDQEQTLQPARPPRKIQSSPDVRRTRRDADIPLDVLNNTYTPPLTSSKASFRSDGSDHQYDQEFALGTHDDGWSEEDRYTNRSGDPRIGTHGRKYEPDEERSH